MAIIKRFEEIQAWVKGRELTRRVYDVSRQRAFASDHALKNQMRRAAISITSNITEGFERESNAAFSHFLSIAKASANEVRSQLYVALDEGYIEQECFDELYHDATQTIRLIGGLINYLHQTRRKR